MEAIKTDSKGTSLSIQSNVELGEQSDIGMLRQIPFKV